MATHPPSLRRDDLIVLRNRYDTEQKDFLNFCYQYLNFYTGMLVTILGATIAGILQINEGRLRDLVLLAGPVLTIILAGLGYSNVKLIIRAFAGLSSRMAARGRRKGQMAALTGPESAVACHSRTRHDAVPSRSPSP